MSYSSASRLSINAVTCNAGAGVIARATAMLDRQVYTPALAMTDLTLMLHEGKKNSIDRV